MRVLCRSNMGAAKQQTKWSDECRQGSANSTWRRKNSQRDGASQKLARRAKETLLWATASYM